MSTIIKLILDSESEDNIQRYIEKNKIISNPKNNFHSTLIYTNQMPIFKNENYLNQFQSYFPIQIDSQSMSFDVFGENELVLKYSNRKIEKLGKEVLEIALMQKIFLMGGSPPKKKVLRKFLDKELKEICNYFNPQITINKNFDEKDLEKLTTFSDNLVFSGFSWQNNY